MRRMHQLDTVARRVDKAEEIAHVALFGVLALARGNLVAAALQHRAGVLQFFGGIHLEGRGVVARIAFEIAQGVVAGIGLEIDRAMLLARHFQPQHRGRIADRGFQIAGTQPDVPDVV